MINVKLGEVVEVATFFVASRAVIVLADAHGNRVEVTLDGVATATQLRDAAGGVRRFHVHRAEQAYAE